MPRFRQGYGSDELVQAIRFADALVTRSEKPPAFGLRSVESGQAAYLALLSALLGLSYPLRDALVRPDGDEQKHRPQDGRH